MTSQASAPHSTFVRPAAHTAQTWRRLGSRTAAGILATTLALLTLPTFAKEKANPDKAPDTATGMDAELFYQLLLGELQLRSGEPGAAYSLMLDAARKTQRPELYRRAVDIALQSRSGPAALDAAQEWAKAAPQTEEPHRFTLQILLALNRATEVGKPLRALLQNTPADKREAVVRAIPAIFARVTDKASSLRAAQEGLQDALRDPATAPAAAATLGRLQQDYARQLNTQPQPDHRLALAMLAQASERLPDDADVAYEHAMTAEKAGLHTEMERLLRRLIAEFPNYHHAYNALGYALADRNERLPEAKALIQKALQLAPDDAYIQDSLGWVEFRLGRLVEAARILSNAFKLKPDAEIAAHLGEVLWAQGQTEQARSIWLEGMKLNPDNETLRATLARLKVTL